MIRFTCSSCGQLMSVDEKHSGKKGKCPKCGGIVVVPERSTIIECSCESCGHKIKVSNSYAGKKGTCPKCKNPVVVPSLETEPAEGAGTVRIACPMCAEAIAVPEGSSEEAIECPACGSYVETSPQSVPVVSEESGASIPPTADDDMYQESPEEYEEPAGVDRRLIVMISAVAAVMVVALVILVVVLRPPRQQQEVTDTDEILTQLELDQVRTLAERYISLLENGEIDEALQLHSPGFGQRKSVIESYSRKIGIRRIVKMTCRRTHCELHPEGDQIILEYNLRYERGGQAVILSMIQIGQELTVDGIAIWGVSGHSLSAGPKTLDALGAAATAASEKSRSFFSKFFCGFAIVLLVLTLVQVVSMWIVFEKAGQPGWASIVPFYNMWVLADIGDRPGWVGLLMCFCGFIPFPYVGSIIGFVLWIIISFGVARTFDRSVVFGIGLSIVPSIFYPILAFTKD